MKISFPILYILANPVPVPMKVFKVFYLGVLPEPIKEMKILFLIPSILANPVPVPIKVFKVFYLGVLSEPIKGFLHKDLALMSEIVTSSVCAHMCNICIYNLLHFLGEG